MEIYCNTEQCIKTGEILRKFQVKDNFIKRLFLSCDAAPTIKRGALLTAVAICEQTRNLHNRITGSRGWEYIEEVFTELMLTAHPLTKPGIFYHYSCDEMEKMLLEVFSPFGDTRYSTLDNIETRAANLINLGIFFHHNNFHNVDQLLETTDNKLINTGAGFIELLAKTTAFSDPQRKKTMFLYKLLNDACLYEIYDKENLNPIMDYHMQRVLLRLGCVVIKDKRLSDSLRNKEPQQSDKPIRSYCIEAMRVIAEASGHGLMAMNDFFWPLGRSCCNEKPVCFSKVCSKSPCTLSQLTTVPMHNNCIFEQICPGATNTDLRNLYEPMVETHFY